MEGQLEGYLRSIGCSVVGPCRHRVKLAQQEVDVYLHLVEAGGRLLKADEPVYPKNTFTLLRKGQSEASPGYDMLHLGGLTENTRSEIRGDLFRLTGQKSYLMNQYHRFESPKAASERRVVARLENA